MPVKASLFIDSLLYIEHVLGEVNEAARRAESWNFINTLPDGMHTRVGDRLFVYYILIYLYHFNFRGHQLSGGQKQRVGKQT